MSRRQSIPSNLFYRAADPLPPLFPEPWEGDIYWNTTRKILRVYTDGAWTDFGSGGGGGGGTDEVFVGPSGPASSIELWVDTDSVAAPPEIVDELDARYAQKSHAHTGVYDPAGTASAAVSAHTAAADPHTGYLKPDEVVAGANITVDAAAQPGKVVIASTASGASDHGALTGLSDPDHPIAAVQGLQTALDGKSPAEHNHDAAYVNVSGDTMTGDLVLKGDATAALHPTTKQQVDAHGWNFTGPVTKVTSGSCDALTATGLYEVSNAVTTRPPVGANWGQLLVMQENAQTSYLTQFWQTQDSSGDVFWRGCYAGAWGPWKQAASTAYVDSAQLAPQVAILPPVGRYLGSVWLSGGHNAGGNFGATTAAAANRGFAYPLFVRSTASFDAWWVSIGTAATDAGSVFSAALYANDAATGLPKTLIADLGSTSATATGAQAVAFTARQLTRGQYWIAIRFKTATTAGTNPQVVGNAQTSLFTSEMPTGSAPVIPALNLTGISSWPADIASAIEWGVSVTNLPRTGLRRSA